MNYLAELREILTTHMSESDLRTLCFDMQIDYENLHGNGKSDKARELLAYAQRTGKVQSLVFTASRLRPDIRWPGQMSEENANQTPQEHAQVIVEKLAHRLQNEGLNVDRNVQHKQLQFNFVAMKSENDYSLKIFKGVIIGKVEIFFVRIFPYLSQNIFRAYQELCQDYVISKSSILDALKSTTQQARENVDDKGSKWKDEALNLTGEYLKLTLTKKTLDFYPIAISLNSDRNVFEFVSNYNISAISTYWTVTTKTAIFLEIPVVYDVNSQDIYYSDKNSTLGVRRSNRFVGRRVRSLFLP